MAPGRQDAESRLGLPALQQGIPLTPPFLPAHHLPPYLEREGSAGGGAGGSAGSHSPLLQHMVHMVEQGHSPIGQSVSQSTTSATTTPTLHPRRVQRLINYLLLLLLLLYYCYCLQLNFSDECTNC